jgi:predicted glutamine amidotransferase
VTGAAQSLYSRRFERGAVIASEPLDANAPAWHEVPPSSVLTIDPEQESRIEDFPLAA